MIITKIHSAFTSYTEESTKNERVNRPCWAIVLKYEGETVYQCNKKTYISNASNLAILPKGCTYKWECTKSGHFVVIEFECDATYTDILRVPLKNSTALELMKGIDRKMNTNHPTVMLECMRDTYSLIVMLYNILGKKYLPNKNRQMIDDAIAYIASNYNKPIKNEDLARKYNISTVYFRKLFTEITGTSPIAYINQFRTEKAKAMLKSDCGTITGIAMALGYKNVYDFSRAFKKHTGTSPKSFQNQR